MHISDSESAVGLTAFHSNGENILRVLRDKEMRIYGSKRHETTENEENCITRSFTICILHQILVE
jgi:hypothetical protein